MHVDEQSYNCWRRPVTQDSGFQPFLHWHHQIVIVRGIATSLEKGLRQAPIWDGEIRSFLLDTVTGRWLHEPRLSTHSLNYPSCLTRGNVGQTHWRLLARVQMMTNDVTFPLSKGMVHCIGWVVTQKPFDPLFLFSNLRECVCLCLLQTSLTSHVTLIKLISSMSVESFIKLDGGWWWHWWSWFMDEKTCTFVINS